MADASIDANTMLSAHSDPPVVLIVDDDGCARALAEAALDMSDFVSYEAENGQQAIEVFTRVRPDIVLLDLIMPIMDGFEACKELRAIDAGVPIIVMTGLDDSESIQKAYDLGATDFIIKPVIPVLLAHRAAYVLRTHRHHVQYDDLTGLPKRDLLLQHLEPELARARRHGRMAALLMIGIDGFERINTSFGHALGDRLLRAYASRLTTIVRAEDLSSHNRTDSSHAQTNGTFKSTIARLGGDEFAIALLDIESAKDAGTVAARICEDLATFEIDGQEISMTN